MNNTHNPLRLCEFSGRENGLVIVGTPEALATLGQQLQTAAALQAHSPAPDGFPVEVASPDVISPYSDVNDFYLSFRIDRGEPVAEVFPRKRRSPSLLLFGLVVVCAVVGVITILQWCKHLLF